MWSCSGRRLLAELLVQPPVRGFSLSAAQNTVIVERCWKVPLSEVGKEPRLHPRRHRIYRIVDDTKHTSPTKMELILTQTVQKLGGRGDTVFVKKSIGRNKLLSQGLAVYPSPENKHMFAEELRLLREGRPEDRVQTRTGQMTVEFLKSSKLNINKRSAEFHLSQEVLIRQFYRKLGVVVPPHALNFPFDSVKDPGDYWCEVTVNGIDTVHIPISLLPFEDESVKCETQQGGACEEELQPVSEEAEGPAAEEQPTTTKTERETSSPPEDK